MTDLNALIKQFNALISSQNHFSVSNESPELSPITENPTEKASLDNYIQHFLNEGHSQKPPNWAAHMTAPPSNANLVGQLLSGLHQGNLLSPELYPLLTQIEAQVLDFFTSLFEQNYGHFTAGSSYGNLEALWQAKQRYPKRQRVYASCCCHYSIKKACDLLGLTLTSIPTTKAGIIELSALEHACRQQQPLAIIATAGTPSTGQFDPITACTQIAVQYDAWLHIDAAWGGGLKLLPECEDLFGSQLSQANSLCFDPHKSWGQPKPASVLLYQRPISNVMLSNIDYLASPPPYQLSGSRGGESFIPLWYRLHHDGIKVLRRFCRQPIEQSQSFAKQLTETTDWPVFHSRTGIICFKPSRDLSSLVQQGVFSLVKRADKEVYRAVFSGGKVSAKALMATLQPYF